MCLSLRHRVRDIVITTEKNTVILGRVRKTKATSLSRKFIATGEHARIDLENISSFVALRGVSLWRHFNSFPKNKSPGQ